MRRGNDAQQTFSQRGAKAARKRKAEKARVEQLRAAGVTDASALRPTDYNLYFRIALTGTWEPGS